MAPSLSLSLPSAHWAVSEIVDVTQLVPFQYWPEVQLLLPVVPPDHPLSQLEGAPRETPLVENDSPEALPTLQFT